MSDREFIAHVKEAALYGTNPTLAFAKRLLKICSQLDLSHGLRRGFVFQETIKHANLST
ncbi:MAG: hypothetical protein PHQ23_01235 [Candidatus Wallbacteria bacterium]|nr:hypothetical protein [Candidatus Wallbacteria bacterium]